MQIESFTKKGPVWNKTVPLNTPYGEFDVRLLSGKPDEQMLTLAGSAARYLESNIDQVVDIVLAHYRWALEHWGHETVHEDERMPEEVGRHNILALASGRAIIIDRLDGEDDPYPCSISFDIPYDEEHGLRLRFKEGRITGINDSEFRLENGGLKYEWEQS